MVDGTGESMSGSGSFDDGEDEKSAAKIRREIEQTRGDMSRTVNQIEERLSPAHIKEQVADLKQSVLGNYHEVKDHVKDDLTRELREAKGKVAGEITEAKQKVRDATVGKVEHMVHDAKEMVHDAGERVTGAGSTVVDIIKANPVPAALVGIGLGWLIMSARSSSSADRRRRREFEYSGYGYRDTDDYYGFRDDEDRHMRGGPRGSARILRRGQRVVAGAAEDALHRVEGTVSDVGHRVQSGASHLAGEASQTAHAVGDKVSHLAHDAVEGAQHLAGGAKDRAMHLAGDVNTQGRRMVRATGRGIRRAEQSVESTLRANPLAVGAVAIAVGAAIGLALPHTRREDEWMGGTKERLVKGAGDMATHAIEKVETTATKQLGGGSERDRDRDRDRDRSRKERDEKQKNEQPNGLSNGLASPRTV
jgi:hypothetical protein